MKKFMTLAAIFAAAMMSFTACEETKPDNGGTTTDENLCPDCGKDPCECPEEYVSPITIDGDFADWDALDASKVASATCATDAKWTALKSVKVYADEVYINVLMEVDADQITSDSPIDIYLNTDNSDNPGNQNWLGQSGQDVLLEGGYYVEGEVISFDPGLYPYTGSDQEVEWAWDVENPLLAEGNGLASGAGTVAKYELAILIELLNGVELADTFGFGITVSQNWEPVGLLPNDTVTDENTNGAAKFLEVTINK